MYHQSKKTGRRSKLDRGFSYLEVVFTILILFVGLLGLQVMTALAVNSISVSKRMSTAVSLAQSTLEQVQANGYESAVSYEEPYGSLQEHPHYQRTVQVLVDEPEPDTKTVRSTVSWNHDLRPKSVTLTGILSNR